MTPKEEIEELIGELAECETPAETMAKVQACLAKACGDGGMLDPAEDKGTNAGEHLVKDAASMLDAKHFVRAAKEILLDGWEMFGRRQIETNKRIHRAIIAYNLANFEFDKNSGQSLRWALYTHADDLLSGNHNGAIKQRLRVEFGISEQELREFDTFANDCRRKAQVDPPAWSTPVGFAEEIVNRMLRRSKKWPYIIVGEGDTAEFPLNKAYLQALLTHASLDNLDSNEKGDALESIAFYLAFLLPGCVPRRNVVDEEKASEYDIVVRHLNFTSNIVGDLLGRHFLMECKNWELAVGASHVGYFLLRMKHTHTKFGIILAKNGISGAADEDKYARALIRRAYHEDGSLCVVINEEDLNDLVSGQHSFWQLLLEKMDEFRFGRAKNG